MGLSKVLPRRRPRGLTHDANRAQATPFGAVGWRPRCLMRTKCEPLCQFVSADTGFPGLFWPRKSKWPKPTIRRKCWFVLILKGFSRERMVLPDRIELSTSPLPMECSTTELRQRAPDTRIGQKASTRRADPCHKARGRASAGRGLRTVRNSG
jgi:hypothetical protein